MQWSCRTIKCSRSGADNTAPKFADDQDPVMRCSYHAAAARSVAENTAKGKAVGDPVVAEDEDGDVLTYTLGGNDAVGILRHQQGHGPDLDQGGSGPRGIGLWLCSWRRLYMHLRGHCHGDRPVRRTCSRRGTWTRSGRRYQQEPIAAIPLW